MEVSAKPVIDLVNYFEKKGLNPDLVLKGQGPADSVSAQSISNAGKLIPWTQFSAAFSRASAVINTQEEINNFVRFVVSNNSSIMTEATKILNGISSCKLLYQLLISIVGGRLFPGAEIKCNFSGNQLLVSTRMHDEDLPNEFVFVLIKNVLEQAPTMIGYSAAKVDTEISGIVCTYRVDMPAKINIFRRTWRLLRMLVNANQIIKDIINVEIGLQRIHTNLITDNIKLEQSLEKRTEEIQHINRDLRQKIKELEEIEAISGSGTWTVNNATKEVHLSESAANILGLDPNTTKISHETFINCIHPEDREEYQIALSRLNSKNPNFHLEHRVKVGGRTRIILQKGKLFTDQQSSTTIGSVFDVTNLRQNEIRLEKERELALEASHHKSQFLASMSHEIRTPMTSVLGFAELISNPRSKPENISSYVATILRNGKNLLALIDDILDLSKVEAGHLRFNVSKFQTRELITQSVEQLETLKDGVTFNVEFSDGIPEIILTDSNRFNQVLQNILGNAVKFTDRGIISILVKPSISKTNNSGIELIVEDMANGMSPEFNRLLFSPYSAFEMDKRKGKTSAALGLALARALAHSMEGDVRLLSNVEQMGTKFSITIHSLNEGPASLAVMQSLENYSIPIDFLSAGPLLNNRKVLIAEDNKDIQEILAKIVGDAGAVTEIANNGIECLEKSGATAFDMILMDLQMPIMDGFETIERLRSGGYKKPIIVVTAYALNNERDRCIKAGCTDFVTKPINGEVLLKTLVRHRNL